MAAIASCSALTASVLVRADAHPTRRGGDNRGRVLQLRREARRHLGEGRGVFVERVGDAGLARAAAVANVGLRRLRERLHRIAGVADHRGCRQREVAVAGGRGGRVGAEERRAGPPPWGPGAAGAPPPPPPPRTAAAAVRLREGRAAGSDRHGENHRARHASRERQNACLHYAANSSPPQSPASQVAARAAQWNPISGLFTVRSERTSLRQARRKVHRGPARARRLTPQPTTSIVPSPSPAARTRKQSPVAIPSIAQTTIGQARP